MRSEREFDAVFWKTAGYCAYCGGGLTRAGRCHGDDTHRSAGAWVVECWVPERAMGPEAQEAPNLWPACCDCHADKNGGNGSEYVLTRRERGLPVHPLADCFIEEIGDWFTRKALGLDRLFGLGGA